LSAEGHGIAIGFVVSPGQRNEQPMFEALLEATRRNAPRHRLPRTLIADRGYSGDALRGGLIRRGVKVVIPWRSDEHLKDGRRDREPFDRIAYRGRNVIERCVGRLKHCRHLATRYDKLAGNFAAMITLGIIWQYLKLPL
jgi:transposase